MDRVTDKSLLSAWLTAHEASEPRHEADPVVAMIAALPEQISIEEAERRTACESADQPVTLESVIAASWT